MDTIVTAALAAFVALLSLDLITWLRENGHYKWYIGLLTSVVCVIIVFGFIGV